MIQKLCLQVALGLTLFAVAAAAQTPTRVRGTVDGLAGDVLTVTNRAGDKVRVTLTAPVHVLALVNAKLADVTPGRNVGIASAPQPDGALRALEITLIPAGGSITPVNGPWDLTPGSRMTNGSVGSVTAAGGRTLTVNYGKGEQKIAVPEGVPVVTPTPGSTAMLVPGAHVVVFARKAEDGALTAGAVAVGKDGVVPPM